MNSPRRFFGHGFGIYLAIAVLSSSLFALQYLLQGKAFAFYAFGSDTLLCYYPLQLAVTRQLHTLHEVTWSFELGLGGYLGTLFDPVWLLTGWLPEAWQLGLRLPVYFAHLVVAGAFFFGYLRLIGIRPLLCVIGGMGYAFSSYGTINAQWDTLYNTDFVQLAAFVFAYEHFLQSGRRWSAVAAGVVVGVGAPIVVYMLGLFCVIYTAARLIAVPAGLRAYALRRAASFLPWGTLGLALTAPLLLPALHYLIDNPRVSGEHSALRAMLSQVLSLNSPEVIRSELAGLTGKDLLGSGLRYSGWQNYFEGPGFYVGLLPLLCVTQLFGRRATRAERALALVGTFGCALYFVWPALRYAVYGFGHMAFRFSTLWISALILVLGITGLQRALLSGWWRAGAVLTALGIATIIVALAATGPAALNVEHVVRVVGFTGLHLALILSASEPGGRTPAFEYLLIAVATCELVLFAVPPLLQRDAVAADGSSPIGRYDDATLQALAFIRGADQSGDFFRIEKTYLSVYLNDSLVQDYPGTAEYSFTTNASTRFVDRLQLPRTVPHPNYVSPMTPRPRILDLLGVRYVLTRDRKLDGSEMTYLATVGGVDVYRNPSARAFATFYDAVASESDADAIPVPQRDSLLLSQAIVEDAVAVEAKLKHLGRLHAGANVQRHADVRRVSENLLYGEVATPRASLLLLSMPFDAGWHARLDGNDVDLSRADYGLTALLVPAGAHRLTLRYLPPGREAGLACQAGALAFLLVFELFPWLSGRLAGLERRRLMLDSHGGRGRD